MGELHEGQVARLRCRRRDEAGTTGSRSGAGNACKHPIRKPAAPHQRMAVRLWAPTSSGASASWLGPASLQQSNRWPSSAAAAASAGSEEAAPAPAAPPAAWSLPPPPPLPSAEAAAAAGGHSHRRQASTAGCCAGAAPVLAVAGAPLPLPLPLPPLPLPLPLLLGSMAAMALERNRSRERTTPCKLARDPACSRCGKAGRGR